MWHYKGTLKDEFQWMIREAEKGYINDTLSKLQACGKHVSLREDTKIYYPENVKLGSYITFNYGCIVMGQGGVELDNYCVLGPHTIIATVTHHMNGIYYDNVLAKPVRIGENVWTGSGSIILPGVEIGDNSIVGAGAVVTKDVPANKVVVGIPARITRDVPINIDLRYQQIQELLSG